MVKDREEVIEEFNHYVNMTPYELERWLKSKESEASGFFRDGSHESVGHESGRHITDILKRNPEKDIDKYTQDDIQHMRKVSNYCKRHMAQESHVMNNPDSKSYKSLKNWGHDPLKAEPYASNTDGQ